MSLIITIVVFAGLAWLWYRSRYHKSTPEEKIPGTYRAILSEKVEYYQKLDKADQAKFEKRLDEFLGDVHIEGVGTEITDIDRVLIASSAVIPIFGFPDWKYKNLTNIILYPDTFDQEFQFEGENRNILGMVGSGYMNGQMLLSRAALVKGFSESDKSGYPQADKIVGAAMSNHCFITEIYIKRGVPYSKQVTRPGCKHDSMIL